VAIDIRAEVSCSLGTLISGSFADDYLQGSGLIKTRGEVVLNGTLTPTVGTSVTFTYDKAGSSYTVPRVLRVLSSFADPFRRTTTVQLGCKLTYLENRKPPVENPNSKDENEVPCKVFLKATLPISAEYVFQQCLDALDLNCDNIPLTNKFSVEEFDLSPGYIQVMSDLLQSEGFVGYLDSNESLRILNLTDSTGSGPVITPDELVDLGPIGTGDLPGESVVVRWSNLRLLPPDELYGDDYLKRSWEVEEIFGAASEVSVNYIDDEGNTVTDTDVYYPYSFSATRYDVWDRKIESISLNLNSSAEVNNRWASDAFKKGEPWNVATARMTNEVVEYKLTAAAANGVDLLSVQDIGGGPTNIKDQLSAAAIGHSGLANLCKEEVPEGAEVVKSQTTYSYFSELELAGSLNIDSYISDGGTLEGFDTVALELDSTVVVEYETDEASGISKTITKRWVSRSQTVSGQQDLATKAQEIDAADLSNSINALLSLARRQVYVGAETRLQTQRQFGLQKRPSEDDRNNTANSKPQISESKAEITWITGSTTSTAVTEFSLPYAPDDEISWQEGSGFSSKRSDAPQKAMRYGRIQNRLLLGNRNGVSLQLAPEQLPKRPFDPLYLQAGGITGSYRVNGTSWAFDSNGIVASVDALLWGAVSAAAGTDLASSWLPLAPGTTSLPLPYTPTSGGLDSETGVTYSAVITPTTVLPPYVEQALLLGVSRTTVTVQDYPYNLDRGTAAVAVVSRSAISVGIRLAAEPTAFALNGQAAGRRYIRAIAGAVGSFSTTGLSAGNVRSFAIGTNAGSFTSTGQIAGLMVQRQPLAATAGSVVLTGQDAQFLSAITLAAASGSFVVTGQNAGSVRSYSLGGSAASFTATGQNANLGVADPNFSSVSLLLHMDGSNGSTSFVDSSANAFTVTAVGNAQISTAQSKFGGSSALFDGTGDYLSIPDSNAFSFGSDAFTIEAWVYYVATTGSFAIASQRATALVNASWTLYLTSSNNGPTFAYSTSGTSMTTFAKTFSFSANANGWHHFAVCRSSNLLYFFADGTSLGTSALVSTPFYDSTAPVLVGAMSSTTPASFMNGYIEELRITKGVARYTANFTVPSQPFPNF
jgi:hypothetical protein